MKPAGASDRNALLGKGSTMAESKCINQAEMAVVRRHLTEIASVCASLRELGVDMTASGNPMHGMSTQALAEKAGILADECSRICGGIGVLVGDWKDWALSPAAKEAYETLRNAGGEAEAIHG